MVAGAVSAAGLRELDRVRGYLQDIPGEVRVDAPDPGKPQTIMALGTDGRLGADAGGGQRSDTILLARMDPDNPSITLTSIPRDLQADIPGYGTDKINAAYSIGGAGLTLQTVKELLSTDDEPFRIHHVVEVNFVGFRDLVDYLGCTYVDIDRDYFNDVSGPLGYATIDIDPGYQELCGDDALDYVRYRHGDTDLVRAARQQDFLRQMLRQPSVQSQLTFGNRDELARLAGRFVRTDKELSGSRKQFLTLLKLGLGVVDKPIQQVPFGLGELEYTGDFGSLVASRHALDATIDRFLHPPEPVSRKRKRKPKKVPEGLVNLESAGAAQVRAAGKHNGLRLYFPKLGIEHAEYEGEPRTYEVGGEPAYRMVVKLTDELGAYYGIQGMKWQDPPILSGPHKDVHLDGRRLSVYADGSKTRLVAWRTKNAVYYVHNTLGHDLTRDQLLGIASSLTHH
jgi:polyisoprenyl-teichoic acid--peptidoglycan teichoic acid transferase